MRFSFHVLLLVCTWLGLVAVATANPAAPHQVFSILPQVGQQGTTVTVIAEGNYLDEPQEVLFYRDGVRCTGFEVLSEAEIYGEQRRYEPGKAVRLTFEIAPDCPAGEHLFRLRTRENLSELMAFWVTTLPIVDETHPRVDRDDNGRHLRNDRPEFAQEVPLNTAVNGLHVGVRDHDWYAVKVNRGQAISVEVLAARLGTFHYAGLNDPAVAVHDAEGNEIVRNDDNALHAQDPVVQFIAERTGRYFIHVAQQMDFENLDRPYLMHVGTFPRPRVCYPLGGQAGKPLDVTLLGDVTGDIVETVSLPAVGLFEQNKIAVITSDNEGHRSFWPNRVHVADFGDFFEPEPKALAGHEGPANEFRHWETAAGKKSTGRLKVAAVDQKAATVTLQREDNRQTVTLPIASLAAADQRLVTDWQQLETERVAARRQAALRRRKPHLISQSLPLAINGKILTEGETDWYRFTARKGEKYRVRTFAKTLDSELDPRVRIVPAEGNPSKRSWDEDDSTWDRHDLIGHHYRNQIKDRLDPIFVFESDVDGDWLLGVSDTRRMCSPQHVYRIELQPHVDSTFVSFPSYYLKHTGAARRGIIVFPGRSYSRPVTIQKGLGAGYNKPLQLRAEGLPAGVEMEAPEFHHGDGSIPVTFSAAETTKPGGAIIDLIVEPVAPEDREAFRGGFVVNELATDRRGGYAMCFRLTRKVALAVVEGAGFDLSVDPPQTPLVRNGTLDLTVRVNRTDGYQGPVYVDAEWLPRDVNPQPPLVIPAGENNGSYQLRAGPNATPGTVPVAVTGRENEGGIVSAAAGLHFVCSPPVSVTIGDPHFLVTLLRAAIERGKRATLTAEIIQQRPFDGEAELRLGRLPYGVTLVEPIPRITHADTKATFHLQAQDDALLGMYEDIFCEALVPDQDQQIREESGSGILRIDPKRG